MQHSISRCPACRQPLQVTELRCQACELALKGQFERGCRFCALDAEQRHLLDAFLASGGVLREMERALGLSYPTVRSRVDALLAALGYAPAKAEAEPAQDVAERRHEILDQLAAGELTAEAAAEALRELAK